LANSFLRSPIEFGEERLFPLDVYFCAGCSLVQLLDVIDPEVLFRNYVYVTGTSTTVARHNLEYAETVGALIGLDKHSLVMEVASNDGSLLECLRSRGFDVLGIEPATNIAQIAEERGIPTVNRFFDSGVARDIRRKYGPASAVVANNVLAHVDGLADFVDGFAELVAPGGLVSVEVPYLANLLDGVEYDTIYHEHLSYFSVTTLTRLFGNAGADRINGGAGRDKLFGGKGRDKLIGGPGRDTKTQ
jgi:SAM-dependent methyltransferase